VKKILLTGANGLLASRLIQDLDDKFILYATYHDQVLQPRKNVNYIRLNLSDSSNWDALPEEIDIVIHLAQSSKYRDFPKEALDIYSVNTNSTAYLLNYAARFGAQKFIYFSTGGLYQPGPGMVSEDSPFLDIRNLNYHFTSKLASELLVNTYSSIFSTVIVRPFFIYGKGQRRTMFMPRVIDQIKGDKPIVMDGTEGLKVNPIHVSDASSFVECLIESSMTGIVNMSGPEVLSIKQICEIISGQMGIRPRYEYTGKDALDLVSSTKKMLELGFEHRTRFSDSVKDLF
jgi:nucleoside-diphosphate-sugar epimerase